MDRVVQVILAGQLVFLGTDRGKQSERADPVGRQLGDVERNATAQAESDDVGLLDVEAVEQLKHVMRVCDDRIVGNLPGRAAETGEVRGDDPEVIGQSRGGGVSVNPGCVAYDGCTAPTIWCSHDDPDYSGTMHGVPCFGIKAMYDFFESLP